jgi:hypothetical protein
MPSSCAPLGHIEGRIAAQDEEDFDGTKKVASS